MNASVRLIFRVSMRDHLTPLYRTLHWLPVKKRIEYKIATICYNSFTGTAPSYLKDLLKPYVPGRPGLRSARDTRKLDTVIMNMKTQGERSLTFQGPLIWNSLPYNIRHAPSVSSFKSRLKTHLFKQAFPSDYLSFVF